MSELKKAAKAAEKRAQALEQSLRQADTESIGVISRVEDTIAEIPYGNLAPWSLNPRSRADADGDAILEDSLFPDGELHYDHRYPMIVMEDPDSGRYAIIQGNRRYRVMAEHGIDSATPIPCVRFQGSAEQALLLALQDSGTGIVEKRDSDVARTVILLMRDHGYSSHTLVAYLWRRGRETLFRVSPATRKSSDLREAQAAARGRLQNLERIARLPESIREEIFAEMDSGARKGKIFDSATIVALSKAKTQEECASIVEQRRTALEAPNNATVTKLTAAILKKRRLELGSRALQEIVALFDTPEKGAERDAWSELMKLDRTLQRQELNQQQQ